MITGLSYIFTTSYSGELFNSLSSIPFYFYAWGTYQILELNYMYIFILHETDVEYGYFFYPLFIIKQKRKEKEIKIIVNYKLSRYLSKWFSEPNSGDLMHSQYIRREIYFLISRQDNYSVDFFLIIYWYLDQLLNTWVLNWSSTFFCCLIMFKKSRFLPNIQSKVFYSH